MKPFLLIIGGILALGIGFIVLLAAEAFIATRGKLAPFENPSRKPVVFGEGSPNIKYVVMGDSTAAGQGAPYDQGIAVETAKTLADDRTVSLVNLGVSGAQLSDLVENQLPSAKAQKPDLVLISAAANDVTGLTSKDSLSQDLRTIVEGLREANPEVNIVFTGSPQMGSVPRLPQPLRWVAGLRVNMLNKMFKQQAQELNITFAPLADQTGATFARNPELFASDRFHPNAAGYEVWVPVLVEALRDSLDQS